MFGSLGMQEILFILVIALIIFGPKKLPQLGRSLGEGLAQFRKASEDFKRSWEQQVTLEEKRLSVAPSSSSPSASRHEPASASQKESANELQKEPAGESKSQA
jgi:sec-independent protein translocase protein TatA